MLSIRLLRLGKKNQPFYKIVVTDKKSAPRGGRPLEILGFYNPLSKEKELKGERIKHWLSVGAKASDTVYNMLIEAKIIEGKKIDVHKESKKEETAASTGAPKKASSVPAGDNDKSVEEQAKTLPSELAPSAAPEAPAPETKEPEATGGEKPVTPIDNN